MLHGKPETWASGIVRTIGWVNFLSDPSQTPHMKMKDIDEGFGVSQASGAANAELVRLDWDIGRIIEHRQKQEGLDTAVIRQLHPEGQAIAAVARMVGLTRKTVYKALRVAPA